MEKDVQDYRNLNSAFLSRMSNLERIKRFILAFHTNQDIASKISNENKGNLVYLISVFSQPAGQDLISK